MRGSSTGALTRTYMHSAIAESLRYDVVESEHLFDARLSHAMMLASLHGNPAADLNSGNEKVHEMYIGALEVLPYFKGVAKRASRTSTEELVEEWRKVNAGNNAGDAAASGERGEEGGDVRG